MTRRWHPGLVSALVLALVALAAPRAASSQDGLNILTDRAEIDYPETVVFTLSVGNAADIEEIELEYGMRMQTCGSGTAKGRPDLRPGSTVHVEWTWNLRASNSPPPGTVIWWRWHLTDSTGQVTATESQEITFDDPNYYWQERTSDEVSLYSAVYDSTVNQALWDAVLDGLDRLEQEAGARPARPVKIYNYPDTTALQRALVHTHEWTGALAFPAFDTVLLAANSANLEWALTSAVHELTHLVIHQVTFNCLGANMPTWLDEGLAVFFEGEEDEYLRDLLEAAIAEDGLLSLQSIGSSFPTDADRAGLAYAQSRAVVAYLIENDGSDAMAQFLGAFAGGASTRRALDDVYGLEILELDNAWRESIGLPPRLAVATETPSPIPTIAPYQAPTTTPTPTAEATATSPLTDTPTAIPPSETPTPTPTRVTPTLEATAPPAVEEPIQDDGNSSWVVATAGAAALALAATGAVIWRRRARSSGTAAD